METKNINACINNSAHGRWYEVASQARTELATLKAENERLKSGNKILQETIKQLNEEINETEKNAYETGLHDGGQAEYEEMMKRGCPNCNS